MNTVSHWMHVDFFTVDQAASLWAGFDPARVSGADSFKPSEVIAARQMLTAGIVSGLLPARPDGNPFASIGDHARSLVSRADLAFFAKGKSLFPAFLFDTLAPFASTGSIWEGGDTPRTTIANIALPVPDRNKGGRPTEHDWDSFILEIIRRANQPDGLPETQAELIRDMLSWFGSSTGKEPAESSVKERVSKIYRYLAKAENPGD